MVVSFSPSLNAALKSCAIGPIAQDFKAAFKLGENDTTISTIDPDGVALSAIQGLYQLAKQQQAALESQKIAFAKQQTALETQKLVLAKQQTELAELKAQKQADAQTQQAIIAELRAQNQKVLERLQKVEAKFIYTER